jgi:hypothetical protein
LHSTHSRLKEPGIITVLAARKWWAFLVCSTLLVAFGLVLMFILTYIDLQGFVALLALTLLIGGICLLVFAIKHKEWGKHRMIVVSDGLLGILFFLAVIALNVSISDYRVREDYLVFLMIAWALVSAALVFVYWMALSHSSKLTKGPYAMAGLLASFVAYLVLAAFLLVTGSFEMTKDFDGWRSNIVIISFMVAVVGITRSTMAIERVDAATVGKSYGRRWAIGIFLLLSGSFLILLGLFSYTYTDVVQMSDELIGATYGTWGYVYRDEAYALIGIGAILLLFGAILLITGWKARPSNLRTWALTIFVFAALIVEVLAAMMIVNQGALDMSSNQWDMKPGDHFSYKSTTIMSTQHKNHTTGELVNFTTGYLNFTMSSKVLEVTGRSEIYLKGVMEFEGAASISTIYKMPKDADMLEIGNPTFDLTYLRDEVVNTPWGPRSCQRFNGQGNVGYDGTYSCDEWVRNGIVIMAIADYQYTYSYDEPKEWCFRHDMSVLTDTSLEEVTEGQKDQGGPPCGSWSPTGGCALNYTWSTGVEDQTTTWRYLIKNMTPTNMLMNLSITSIDDPSEILNSGETWSSTGNTTLGIVLYPDASMGPYSVLLIGNESKSTPWGQLECSHYLVTHILEDADSYTREDLYVRDGVLLSLESCGLSPYSMTLAETNLKID